MLGARQRLLDLRSSRIEQLLRVRALLRGVLADFFETLDPLANVRLAEVSAEGSKAHGDLAISLSFFEGTTMRIAVDATGRFSHILSIPSGFDDVARIVAIEFSNDMTRAEVLYEPVGAPGERRRFDLVATVLALLAHAVASVEEEASEAPAPERTPAHVAGTPGSFAPRLSVVGRGATLPSAAATARTANGAG